LQVDGDPVPAGPMLWTVVAPRGLAPAPDAAPLPVAAAAMHRAAAQVRLAGNSTRAAGPAAADTARAARTRAAFELRRTDAVMAEFGELRAGPGEITLATWRAQLVEALRPGNESSNVPEVVDELPYDDAFARGTSVSWYLPAGEDGPRLTWPQPASNWPARSLRTAAVALAGVLGLWWGRRVGARVWPEQLMLLGCAAWAADVEFVWLLPTLVGVGGRLSLIAGPALRKWFPAPVATLPPSESAR
jgi:hypothetical protein